MSETVHDLLAELASDNQPPEERWIDADSFDPPFLKGTLRNAAKRKLIELDTKADPWRFRLTAAGREELASEGRLSDKDAAKGGENG